ncbi:MAG TPA: aldo/keto reductase [Gaiellaceae bacterium]|nr:aldo/keto reductase [Gaiellaceae bacterium]
MALRTNPLGSSGIEVSALSLGSWRTYERIPRAQALSVLEAARDAGITFLDDARYNDETGTAPLASGYSEVLFGELFRATGWARDQVVIANKLWWEFWPAQSAQEELESSLARTGLDYLDLEYALPPPPGLEIDDLVSELGTVIASGKLRAWGVANWAPQQVAAAARAAERQGVPPPCAAQLQYSLVNRTAVEDPEMLAALELAGASVVASASLQYGALSGKYAAGGTAGRIADEVHDPAYEAARGAAVELEALGARLGTAPATLAYAFALSHAAVASVLFGATRPEQVVENVAAAALLERIDASDRAALSAIGRGA